MPAGLRARAAARYEPKGFHRTVLTTAAESQGLTGLHPHALRHTTASLVIASGANVKGRATDARAQVRDHGARPVRAPLPDQLDEVADRLDAAARAVLYPLCPEPKSSTIGGLRTSATALRGGKAVVGSAWSCPNVLETERFGVSKRRRSSAAHGWHVYPMCTRQGPPPTATVTVGGSRESMWSRQDAVQLPHWRPARSNGAAGPEEAKCALSTHPHRDTYGAIHQRAAGEATWTYRQRKRQSPSRPAPVDLRRSQYR